MSHLSANSTNEVLETLRVIDMIIAHIWLLRWVTKMTNCALRLDLGQRWLINCWLIKNRTLSLVKTLAAKSEFSSILPRKELKTQEINWTKNLPGAAAYYFKFEVRFFCSSLDKLLPSETPVLRKKNWIFENVEKSFIKKSLASKERNCRIGSSNRIWFGFFR